MCALISSFCISQLSADIFDDCNDDDDDYKEFNYIKIGGALTTIGQKASFMPVVGIGKRLECPDFGIDYSATFGYAKGLATCERSNFFYSVPKILCLSYLDPCGCNSFYWGAGASWGGLINKNSGQTFHGIMGEATFGYEMNRGRSFRSFIQLDISQPVIAAYRRGKFPSATGQLTFALGF